MSTHDAITNWVRRDEEGVYECRTCGTTFDLEHYVCPECDGFSVERP